MINYINFDQPDCIVKAGQHYRHYKHGNMYTVICIAIDCENSSKYLVVYQGWLSGKIWVRSLEDFTSDVSNEEDIVVPRFELVGQPIRSTDRILNKVTF